MHDGGHGDDHGDSGGEEPSLIGVASGSAFASAFVFVALDDEGCNRKLPSVVCDWAGILEAGRLVHPDALEIFVPEGGSAAESLGLTEPLSPVVAVMEGIFSGLEVGWIDKIVAFFGAPSIKVELDFRVLGVTGVRRVALRRECEL